jgi:cytochrome bd-type quinol oxidase subunit 2
VRRLRRGEWLAAAGGVALLALLWAPWYDDADAWSAFSVLDVLLAILALLGIVTAFLQATRRSPALPVAADVIASTVGLIAVIALAVRVLFPPGDGSRAWGLAAGFVSCLAVFAGAWLALRDE